MNHGSRPAAQAPAAAQIGALPYRRRRGRIEVLMVTSRRRGRWILPKGWPIAGLDAAGAAAREAWEEAGVVGEIGHRPLGRYHYVKRPGTSGRRRCEVTLYPLRVTHLSPHFPERGQRRRAWITLVAAVRRAEEPGLARLLARLEAGSGGVEPPGGRVI